MPERPRVFFSLLAVRLLQWRGEWLSVLLVTLVLPLGLVTALTAFPFATTPATRALLIAASSLLAMLGLALLLLPGQVARMRVGGQVHFFAAFPIDRAGLLASWLVADALVALPGTLLAPMWAAYQVRSTMGITVGQLFAWLLTSVGVLALGNCLGLARLRPSAAQAGGVALFGAMLLGVLMLAVRHPLPWAHLLGVLLPASLGADLAAAALPLSGGHLVVTDFLLLLIYAVGFVWLANRLLPWRAASPAPVQPVPTPQP